MNRAWSAAAACLAFPSLVSLVACGGAAGARAGSGGSGATGTPVAAAVPDVEIRDANGAFVGGKAIPMDGVAEGLAWPALRGAVARKPGDHAPLTIAVARGVPMNLVLRAVWTLRDADLLLQTPDPAGARHVLELRPKPDAPPVDRDAECHLAVFVAPNGDVGIASPGSHQRFQSPGAATALASALASERTRCPIRYVGFGAENADAAWSAVFDVARAVDQDKSAGDARYVLAEPLHLAQH